MSDSSLVPAQRIEQAIFLLRGEKVMLDSDLAELYGVENKLLIRAVRRNRDRFPKDFMFQLTDLEYQRLRIQIGSSNQRGGRRYRPFAFTEQGVAMLSCVLRSKRAVQVNIEIMRAFVRLRRWLASHALLARRLDAMEKKYDSRFQVVFVALRKLMATESSSPPRKTIGFRRSKPET